MQITIAWAVVAIIVILIMSSLLYYLTLRKRNCKFMSTLYGTVNGKIQSADFSNTALFGYNLRDYYIKTAYNACSGGNYRLGFVDVCNLKSALKMGCRGLDFAIFSIDNQPVVATSTSDSYTIKETFNYIPITSVLDIIRDNAFASSTAPNFSDPVIVHLRIHSANAKMFENFATILESYDSMLLGKEYSFEYGGKNLGSVALAEFQNKVIVIVDRSNTAFLNSQRFYEYVNMTSNSVFMRALRYYNIKYVADIVELTEFNKLGMTLGMPDNIANPSNPNSVVMREMGCQMLGMRYSYLDEFVEENDVFFDNAGYAFVLKPERLRYKPILVDAPPPPDPALSYAPRVVSSDYYNFNI